MDGIIVARFARYLREGLNVRCDSYDFRTRNGEKETERERHDIVNKYISRYRLTYKILRNG